MKNRIISFKAIALVLVALLTINLSFALPSQAQTSITTIGFDFANTNCANTKNVAALPIVKNIFAGTPPSNLGVHEGLLSSCPESPNCVVTQNADQSHAIAPINYQTDLATARDTLLKVLTVVPGTKVITQTDNYIRAESTSRLMGFIDDVEFYFPAEAKVIEMRSASRLGESDLGVNRRRLEQIRFAMTDLQV